MEDTTVRINQYRVQDIDDSGDTRYYGFVDEVGDWFIMKYDTINKSIRYHRRSVENRIGMYSSAWNNRTTLMYGYWDVSF